MIPMFEKQK